MEELLEGDDAEEAPDAEEGGGGCEHTEFTACFPEEGAEEHPEEERVEAGEYGEHGEGQDGEIGCDEDEGDALLLVLCAFAHPAPALAHKGSEVALRGGINNGFAQFCKADFVSAAGGHAVHEELIIARSEMIDACKAAEGVEGLAAVSEVCAIAHVGCARLNAACSHSDEAHELQALQVPRKGGAGELHGSAYHAGVGRELAGHGMHPLRACRAIGIGGEDDVAGGMRNAMSDRCLLVSPALLHGQMQETHLRKAG